MANNKTSSPAQIAAGVDALIDRLRSEGVANGRSQAEQIISDAKAEAEAIINQAQAEAEQLISQARTETDNIKRGGQEALKVAGRDTMLALKSQLAERFTGEVQRLVGTETDKPELLTRMILEVVGRAQEEVSDSKEIEVLLPRKVEGLEDLSRNPEELEQGILTHFVRLVGRDMLKEGVTFGVVQDNQGGLKLRLVDQEVVLDISDRAIADVILQHLQPRFRALIEGMVG